MAMRRILDTVKTKLKATAYRLSKVTGISEGVLSAWNVKDSTTVNLGLLARLRKASGLSWNQMGALIDEEIEK